MGERYRLAFFTDCLHWDDCWRRASGLRRTLLVVIAAGTAASTACLFLMYADLPSFFVGVLSLITAFSLGVCGYPLLLAIVCTVVPPRRRLMGFIAPIAVALLVEAVL